MNKLKKVIYATVATALLISTGVMAGNVGTMNTFSSGTPAVANDVNANFTEQTTQINNNDTRISTLENNFGKTFSSFAYMRIPNLAVAVAGTSLIDVYYVNKSITDCDMYIATSQKNWEAGSNTFSSFAPVLTYSAITLVGKTFAIGSSTTQLRTRRYSLGDVSGAIFVDFTVNRDETNVLDTCGPNDVLLFGAKVVDPNPDTNSNRHFIPLSEMKVK